MSGKLLHFYSKTYSYLLPKLALLRLIYYHWSPLVYFAVFTLIKYVVWAVQEVTWRISGVHGVLREIHAGRLYEKSAHVKRIIKAYKQSKYDKVRENWHFIYVHESFQHPEYVLRDDVILADVDFIHSKAVFVQMPHPLNYYTAKRNPFLFITLGMESLKIIELPFPAFNRLADKVGHPTTYEKIMIMHHAGRCGSTFVLQLIEQACGEDSLNYSEPPTFLEMIAYKNRLPRELYMRLLKSALYLFFKPVTNIKRVTLKNLSFNTYNAEDMQEILPEAQMFYVYREPLRFTWSMERAFGNAPVWAMLYSVVFSRLWPFVFIYFNLPRKPWVEHGLQRFHCTMFELCVIMYGELWASYSQQSKKFDFPSLDYEDFLENPEKFCRRLLALCQLPESRLAQTMSIAAEDSQEGTLFSQDILRNIPVTRYSPELKKRTDYYCDIIKVPRLDWTLCKSYRERAGDG